MNEIGAFFAMGGKAAFVWPSFAVTLGLMGLLALRVWRRFKASERRLAALEAAGGGASGDEAA